LGVIMSRIDRTCHVVRNSPVVEALVYQNTHYTHIYTQTNKREKKREKYRKKERGKERGEKERKKERKKRIYISKTSVHKEPHSQVDE
jgi:hypothetical protein